MPSINIRLDDETHKKIAAIAAEKKTTVTQFVRDSIHLALADRAVNRDIENMRAFIRAENDELFRALIKRRDEVISANAETSEENRIELIEWIKKNLQ